MLYHYIILHRMEGVIMMMNIVNIKYIEILVITYH